jgi:hypothetical protein
VKPQVSVDASSVLLITLDSCRYDTFETAKAPSLRSVGPLHRAWAPGTFTFSSHAAMFMGFTPGNPAELQPYLNPKYGRIFRLDDSGAHVGPHPPFASLPGRDIVDGFRELGYLTVGTGAVRWFDPDTRTSRLLVESFERFFYPGNTHSLRRQVDFALDAVRSAGRPLFLFMNVGETHVPYWHAGAPWPKTPNPCVPFGKQNDAAECRRRQLACLEFVDEQLAGVLDAFIDANVVVCSDHGDAWGEDGLWEHGIHHRSVLEVPLVYRLNGRIEPRLDPVAEPVSQLMGGTAMAAISHEPSGGSIR